MQIGSYKASLAQLLDGFSQPGAVSDQVVHGLVNDSRLATAGCIFFAFPGESCDGREYIEQAIERGAAAVVYEAGWAGKLPSSVPHVAVQHVQKHLGAIAARFYDDPSRQLTVVGVTGTNGKTSVTQFLAQAISAQKKVAVIGTLGAGVWPVLSQTGFTTPDAIHNQAFLAHCRDQAVEVVVMEVSSHALVQGRVNAIDFDIAVFTNLTHEHLDYHGDMQQYAAAKEQLLQMPGLEFAVLNTDDPVGKQWVQQYQQKLCVHSYGLQKVAGGKSGICADQIREHEQGIAFQLCSSWGDAEILTPLLGSFNVSNLLAVFVVLQLLDGTFEKSIAALQKITPVAGRMQWFAGPKQPNVVVDFSHTPDALQQALMCCRQHCQGQLWCVFGCGGHRDVDKRPKMGKIAAQLSDHVVITNDNPRDECPEQIAEDICQGIGSDKVTVILDRAKAIEYAIQQAAEEDWVLVAGKGHESEQVMGKKRLPFNDSVCVQQQLSGGVS